METLGDEGRSGAAADPTTVSRTEPTSLPGGFSAPTCVDSSAATASATVAASVADASETVICSSAVSAESVASIRFASSSAVVLSRRVAMTGRRTVRVVAKEA